MRTIDEVTGIIVDAAYRIHTGLGPGLLESVYEVVLARELERCGLNVERQRIVSFDFDGMSFLDAFRVDLLVENAVVVELKSVEQTIPLHGKQLLTYLRLMNLNVGLLINFGAATLKEGLKRIVNDYNGPYDHAKQLSRRAAEMQTKQVSSRAAETRRGGRNGNEENGRSNQVDR